MKIYFNSKSKLHKIPFGAVKTNESVLFTLTAEDGIYIESIRIIIIKNNSVAEEHYLKYQGFSDNVHKYICNLCFPYSGIYKYYFIVKSEEGSFKCLKNKNNVSLEELLDDNFHHTTEDIYKLWQLTVYDENFKTPDWAYGKIMYQIFPDRFKKSENYKLPETKNPRSFHECWNDIPDYIYDTEPYTANDFFGGNFKGIEEQLPYLKELGVDIIYLNPIFESGANHRYSTADYKNADPYLGTNDDFSHLCSKAKKEGIRIIIDGVFSHTGDDSIYFNKFNNYPSDGAYNNPDSPYRSWYNFKENSNEYECWWGFENLPNVNELQESYFDFITNEKTGVLKFWKDMGISGWRLDVADELPDFFIDALRSSIKKSDPDALIIGEVWEDATTKESYGIKRRYLLGNQLDSVMNYPFRTAILNYALGKSGIDFENLVMSILENYPLPSLNTLMNSISTHDTIRALTVLSEVDVPKNEQGSYKMSEALYEKSRKRLFMCVFLQFTLPGIPTIYYGDEVGLYGYRDPYNRCTYPYGREDFSIFEFHKELSDIRKKYNDAFIGNMEILYVTKSILCYKRKNLIFITNNCEEALYLKIENLKEKIYGSDDAVFGKYGIIIPPYSYLIFTEKS